MFKLNFGKYGNMWSFGISFIQYVGWTGALVLDFGPWFVEIIKDR